MTDAEKVFVYWDAPEAPADVLAVVARWREKCPEREVELFNRDTARQFLTRTHGATIAALFDSCALPAMRSDFFRVFRALEGGGLYCDVTFAPQAGLSRAPEGFGTATGLSVVRWNAHGRIVNGIFHAKAGNPLMQQIAYALTKGVSLRRGQNVWSVTGPGVWIPILDQADPASFKAYDSDALFTGFLQRSGYTSSTRGTDQHWSKAQEAIGIFAD